MKFKFVKHLEKTKILTLTSMLCLYMRAMWKINICTKYVILFKESLLSYLIIYKVKLLNTNKFETLPLNFDRETNLKIDKVAKHQDGRHLANLTCSNFPILSFC